VSALPPEDDTGKLAVGSFWEAASCGEVYAAGESERERYEAQARARYALEPFIFPFARFPEGAGRDVLEVGVGMGADHLEWARVRPRRLAGIDLTSRAVEHTSARLALYGLSSELRVGDAETLPFPDNSFDLVYSWGVLHHSPDTPRAVEEVRRVLRPGGSARVMMYHRHSLVGAMLWARYALLTGRPWRSLDDVYAKHLESPGTKAFTDPDVRELFSAFSTVRTSIELSNGDLLEGAAGQRHHGLLLRLARGLWPRSVIRRFFPGRGLFLLVDAVK
jgi:SAM-dependent methyltransferase